jgi:hypothetical protein
MKKMMMLFSVITSMMMASCCQEHLEYQAGDLSVCIEAGDGWLHDYPLFLGIKKKNPPQIAVWLEDVEGRYLGTLYASKKIATQGWSGAGGNRRKEALPYWCHRRGVVYDDGLYLPTKSQPLVDGMTGATPKGDFDVRLKEKTRLRHFYVMVEVNHSIDFNDRYSDDKKEGETDYSGGSEGSGQPALVYRADVDLDSARTSFDAVLIGRSSADGTDGKLYDDLYGITSALTIVKRIKVNVK